MIIEMKYPIVMLAGRKTGDCLRFKIKRISFVLLLILVCTGCVSVGPNEQRLVSKPNMVFSESAVFSYENKLLPQLEPGSAVSGGQTSGCTSCK